MDPVSQGVVGALVAQCVLPARHRRLATVMGALAGMSADLDLLIHSEDDPLFQLTFHRHFTHCLLFIPVGATLVAGVVWPIARRWAPFALLWSAALAGYATAGLLDACTSYGTHLLWPLSDVRTSWSCISIVDPLFTLSLLVMVVIAAVRRRGRLPWVAASIALAYLALGVCQRERAEAALLAHAEGRHHVATRLSVKPTMGNLVLWRGIYFSEGRWHVDAVRIGFGAATVVEGVDVPALDGGFPGLPPDSVAAGDIERFRHFSDGYLAILPDSPREITDLRYARLPHQMAPLWTIEVDAARPEKHVRFNTYRSLDSEERELFMDLLLGR